MAAPLSVLVLIVIVWVGSDGCRGVLLGWVSARVQVRCPNTVGSWQSQSILTGILRLGLGSIRCIELLLVEVHVLEQVIYAAERWFVPGEFFGELVFDVPPEPGPVEAGC